MKRLQRLVIVGLLATLSALTLFAGKPSMAFAQTSGNALSFWGWADDDHLDHEATVFPTAVTSNDWKVIGRGAAIKFDGTLWTTRRDVNATDHSFFSRPFQTQKKWVAAEIDSGFGVGIEQTGTLWELWENYGTENIGGTDTWRTISLNERTFAAIRNDGTLFQRTYIRERVPTFLPVDDQRWKDVSVGSEHVLAIRADNTLWGWGTNDSGELGDGTTIDRPTPTLISGESWSKISAGNGRSVAIRADGALFQWGALRFGDGLPSSLLRSPTIAAPGEWIAASTDKYVSAAIRKDGTLWTWGSNAEGGELGDGVSRRPTPGQIGTLNSWNNVVVSDTATLGLSTDAPVAPTRTATERFPKGLPGEQGKPFPQLSPVAGTGAAGFSDGIAVGPNESATFRNPMGIAYDDSGSLFVADEGNHAIRKISTNGLVSTIAGNGMPGFVNGRGGRKGVARFNRPTDVAIDKKGNLYVADAGNLAIRKIDTKGNVTTVAGKKDDVMLDQSKKLVILLGELRSVPNDRPTTDAKPTIAIDTSGNIFVAKGGRVRRIDHNSGGVSTFKTDPTFDLTFSPDGALVTMGYDLRKRDQEGNTVMFWDFAMSVRFNDRSGGRWEYEELFDRLAFDREGNLYSLSRGKIRKSLQNGQAFDLNLGAAKEYVAGLPRNFKALEIDNAGTVTLVDSDHHRIFRLENPIEAPVDNNSNVQRIAAIFSQFAPTQTIEVANPNKPALCAASAALAETWAKRVGDPRRYESIAHLLEWTALKDFGSVAPDEIRSEWNTLIAALRRVVDLNKKYVKGVTVYPRLDGYHYRQVKAWFQNNCGYWFTLSATRDG
jgi:hypothetical protein